MNRNKKIAALHVAKRDMQLDDATYRSMLQLATGKTSSANMNDNELDAALAHFRKKGFNGRPRRRKQSVSSTHAFIRSLWISLYHIGAIKDKRDTALDAFVKRQVGIDHAEWVKPDEAAAVIEALKDMCAREGFNVADVHDGGLTNKRRLVVALLYKIDPQKVHERTATPTLFSQSPAELDRWAKRLGEELRDARA